MEHNYSIDELIEKIHISKTKEYFKEVISTYYSNAYRACIVTLYTVVICDLIFKLEELTSIYNDDVADKILKEIDRKQKENPKSPDWENEIVSLIKDRTTLLEQYEVEAIYQLQKQRHLSAHPILSESSILYTPNKETITAHIKNMLAFVLTKPAYFSKKLVVDIIIDISNNKNLLLKKVDLKRYLEVKYFRNLKQEVFNKLFKTLWKFSFKIDDDECSENRDINIIALEIIYDRNSKAIEDFISTERDFFNFINNREVLPKFFLFLFDHPNIYQYLSDAIKTLIDVIESNNIQYKFISWFKHNSFDAYFEEIETLVEDYFPLNGSFFKKAYKLSVQYEKEDEYLSLAIILFGKSTSFDTADIRFSNFIEPYLNKLSIQQLESLIEVIEENSQISSRRRARLDNGKVANVILSQNPDYDFSKWEWFDY